MSDSLQQLQEIDRTGGMSPLYADVTGIGYGANMLDPVLTEGIIYMPDSERGGHFGCMGTTRIGKTRVVESFVEQDIRKGFSVAVIDPKATSYDAFRDLTPHQKVQLSRHADRPYTLDYVNEIFTDFQELHGDRAFADAISSRILGRAIEKQSAIAGRSLGRMAMTAIDAEIGSRALAQCSALVVVPTRFSG